MEYERDAPEGTGLVPIGELGRTVGGLLRTTLEHVEHPGTPISEKACYVLFFAAVGASAVGCAVRDTAARLLPKAGQ